MKPHVHVLATFAAAVSLVVIGSTLGAPPAAGATGWTAPARVTSMNFAASSDLLSGITIAVDANGKAHIAAAGVTPSTVGIWYLTNVQGTWTTTRVARPPRSSSRSHDPFDGSPSIAIDGDGSASIAFLRYPCWNCAPNPARGIFFLTRAGGRWSNVQQVAEDWTVAPSLAMRNGHAYLAYGACGYVSYPLRYTTDVSGDWSTRRLNRAEGCSTPRLLLNGNGIPQIISLVKSSADEGLGYWRGISASGLFKPVNRIPRAGSHVGAFGAGLKPDGRPVVGWTAYDADWHVSAIYVAERNASGWSRPVELPAVGYLMGLAVDGIGATHVLAIRPDGALIYVTDRTGSWMTQVLYSGRVVEASLALGPDGSPHVVYTVGSPTSSAGVYYMKGAG